MNDWPTLSPEEEDMLIGTGLPYRDYRRYVAQERARAQRGDRGQALKMYLHPA